MFNYFSAGIEFRRQILTSKVDARTERVNDRSFSESPAAYRVVLSDIVM